MSADGSVTLEVLDALGAFASLEKRSPTLDGSVPLRVVQGCVPFLLGNELGWQLTLHHTLLAQRTLGVWRARWEGEVETSPDVRLRAALPVWVLRGLIERDGEAHRQLARGMIQPPEVFARTPRFRLFSGLFVRPPPSLVVRVASSGNRRSASIDVVESTLASGSGWQPLWVDFTVAAGVDELSLGGEAATVMLLTQGAGWRRVDLADAPEVGRAHVDFYDPAYFAAKRGTITRKYRRVTAHETTESAEGAPEWIDAGHASVDVGVDGGGVPTLTVRNQHSFRVRYDGLSVRIDHDAVGLATRATALRAKWSKVYGPEFVETHWRALLYLTKYFTPHPPGEAHFFVKPEGFARTPAGWSCLLEGVPGVGYDVMRGVVSTDVFHATPAVFFVRALNQSVDVPEGRALVRVVPFPRRLMAATLAVTEG